MINFGEYRRAAQQTFQTAFILQGDESVTGININTGTANWKVIKNKAYECIPFTSDSLGSYYIAGPGEKVDAGLCPWGWKDTAFDDHEWLTPKKGTVEFAVGRGFLYGGSWFLVPRPIPFMEEKVERFKSIARTENIKSVNRFIDEGVTASIPPHTKAAILLDNKTHTTGYPELIISKGKNAKIKITYAESLFKPKKTSPPGEPMGNFAKEDLKGDRNAIEGKNIFGYYDMITADGGANRSFRSFSRKTFRYVQFDIQTSDEELLIKDYHNVYTGIPLRGKSTLQFIGS